MMMERLIDICDCLCDIFSGTDSYDDEGLRHICSQKLGGFDWWFVGVGVSVGMEVECVIMEEGDLLL